MDFVIKNMEEKKFGREIWRFYLVTLTKLVGPLFFPPKSFHILSFLNSGIKKREADRWKWHLNLIINPENLKLFVEIFKLKIV